VKPASTINASSKNTCGAPIAHSFSSLGFEPGSVVLQVQRETAPIAMGAEVVSLMGLHSTLLGLLRFAARSPAAVAPVP
jgi:hypothetical protein